MVEFIDLDSLLGDYVDSVTLKGDLANSTLKLFGNSTSGLVEEHQAHMRRQSNQFKVNYESPEMMLRYLWVEHLARLGALAANHGDETSNLYDLGSGIALPSLAAATSALPQSSDGWGLCPQRIV